MSARGARSRKAVAKDIEKKEKKAAEKRTTDAPPTPRDVFAEWPPPPSHSSRDATLPSGSFKRCSNGSQATSRSGSTNPAHTNPCLNTIHSHDSFDFKVLGADASASRSTSISGSSTQDKEKEKYQTKTGKGTKAPRGRGGGVPVKKPVLTSPALRTFRSESSAARLHPSQKTWIDFKIWESRDSLPPYGGWDYDEHLQRGNVLVYFKEEQLSEEQSVAQIRCDLGVLENSGSTWLRNALLYGCIEDHDVDWDKGGSPSSSQSPHGFPQPPVERRMLSSCSPGGTPPSPFHIDQAYFEVSPNGIASRAQYYSDIDRSRRAQSQNLRQPPGEAEATHELWFTAPADVRTPQEQRLHHVAIRNFLAMLHGKPIVGADLYEMLTTLQAEIQVMYDLDHNHDSRSSRDRSVQMIVKYLIQRGFDDVRNNIKNALALLAWSEQENVKWRQGYLESFVHLAGVMSPQMEELADFKRLSMVTRRNLAIAAKSLQVRIMETEQKLSSFDFSEFWVDDVNIKGAGSAVHQSYTAFRHLLIGYVTRTYGNWPPTPSQTWLNRKLLLALQQDFGGLYDYLVDRDIIWDSAEERPGRKWEMVNPRNTEFRADSDHLSLTDLLVQFDNRHAYLHIPHPYPLLPKEIPAMGGKGIERKKGLFGGLKKQKVDKNGGGEADVKAQLQLSIMFGDATNVQKADVEFNGNTLIDSFERFELSSSTAAPSISPRDARLGRWILLYGILQVLSTLSVDVRDLKWTQGVNYFLCADLKRCPEWVVGADGQKHMEAVEASQLRSWCWQRPWAPTVIEGKAVELEGEGSSFAQQQQQWVEEFDADIRRLGRKIERMQVSSMAMTMEGEMDAYSIASGGEYRLVDRRIWNEKVKSDEFEIARRGLDVGKGIGTDGSFGLTQADYELRDWDGDLEPPIIPMRSPQRRPKELHKGFEEPHQPQQRQGEREKEPYLHRKAYGHGRDWPEERAGWV